MKTKHTPGPWYASDNERCIYAKLQTVDGTYVEPLIAQCTKLSTSANANAALIAASPEMFEALLIAKKLLDETRQGNNYLERGQVNKALCKALGLDYSSIKTEEFESILKKARGE